MFDGREEEGCEYGCSHGEMRLEEIHSCATGFDMEGIIGAV